MWPASGKGVPTFAPLVILASGLYYDASAYLASPVPLAAQPGTVYEGQRSGQPVGLFTVQTAREVNDNWLALGTWHEGIETSRPAVARQGRGRASESDSDERPILHKHAGSESPTTPTTTTTPPAAPPPSPASATAPPPPASQPASEEPPPDSNRPVLRRGKPTGTVSEDIPAEIAKAIKSTPLPASPKTSPQPVPPAPKVMVAVSDAQSSDERSFLLPWKAEDEVPLTKKAVALAQQEITKWAAFRQQTRGAWPLEDVQVKFFDLMLDNNPEIVLTARQPAVETTGRTGTRRAPARKAKETSEAPPAPPLGDVYITLVARTDLDGNLRTLFTSVTDARHLDVSPRLELIDAVDADGEGYGELLFHKIWGASSPLEGNVVLYRVGPDGLVELFDSSGQ